MGNWIAAYLSSICFYSRRVNNETFANKILFCIFSSFIKIFTNINAATNYCSNERKNKHQDDVDNVEGFL